MIIAFSIYNILNMTVNHKKRDIAILRSMGFDQIQTTLLFLLQGILLGLFGALLGIAIGALGCAYAQTIPTPRGNMSISWDIDIYIQGFLLIFVSSLLASFIPARNAGKLSPIEIIRGTL
jgi:lipoprotein-releasing system permease protein